MQFFRLLPKISPNLGYIFTPHPSYFKVLDPPPKRYTTRNMEWIFQKKAGTTLSEAINVSKSLLLPAAELHTGLELEHHKSSSNSCQNKKQHNFGSSTRGIFPELWKGPFEQKSGTTLFQNQ
jgi:hypothetical protein